MTRLLNHLYYAIIFVFFFFNDTATTEIYTLSLHDALPTCWSCSTPAIPGGGPFEPPAGTGGTPLEHSKPSSAGFGRVAGGEPFSSAGRRRPRSTQSGRSRGSCGSPHRIGCARSSWP